MCAEFLAATFFFLYLTTQDVGLGLICTLPHHRLITSNSAAGVFVYVVHLEGIGAAVCSSE